MHLKAFVAVKAENKNRSHVRIEWMCGYLERLPDGRDLVLGDDMGD